MSCAQNYEAVIFDLWGTLVDSYPRRAMEVAGLLGVEQDDFARAWSVTLKERMVGTLLSTEAVLAGVCRELRVEPKQGRVRDAAQFRLSYVRKALTKARPGSLETLAALKESGYKTGLITNCDEETSRLWPSTPFASLMDTAVLSYEVGLAKPDPRIFVLAAHRLGVKVEGCLFVGDGGSGELTGAAKAGMTAMLVCAPHDREDEEQRGWTGHKISAIPEVLDVLL